MDPREKIPPFLGFLKTATVLSIFCLTLFALPHRAFADSIHGLLEYIYINSNVKTTDITGVTTKTKNDGLRQRYNLTIDKTIYPSLIISGGGLFEYGFLNSTTDGVDSRSTSTWFSPYVDLVLNNPIITAGVGYRRREESASTNGEDSPKQIQDLYSATFGWHPVEFPSIDLYYMRRYFYDEDRTSLDTQTDNITWISNYLAIKGLEINYNGNYNLVQDKLTDSETETLTNSGRIAYSGGALNDRVIYHTSYNISIQNTTIKNSGFTQVLPLNQLFATTPDPTASPPTTVTTGRLTPYGGTLPAVNLVAPLTLPAVENNIGLSFDGAKGMDTIFLSIISRIDPVDPSSTRRVPPTVADLNTIFAANPAIFSFSIYTSSDGENWGPPLGITPASVTVGRNPTSPGSEEVGFVVRFSEQNTRYIKVVQTPAVLPPATIADPPPTIDPNNVLVASIQTFRNIVTTPGRSVTSETISGLYDLNLKALILDDPNLSYDLTFTFTHNKSDQSPLTTTYLLNNGVSLAKKLGEIWTVNARLADEFNVDSEERIRNTVTYNAGLAVNPLPTLSHSLVYSGRYELFEGETTLTNSVYLNNSAELYRGLSVNLGAGYNNSQFPSGQDTDSIVITFGAEIVPHRNFTLNLGYQDNYSRQSGGDQPSSSSYNRTLSATATYRPFEAVYLTGGYSIFMQNDRDNVTLQNYGISWSPFRGGDLQFNLAYSEAYDSGQDLKDRNLSPSLRWNIRPGSTLDVSYNILDSTSGLTGDTEAETFGAQLRITF